MWRDCGVLGSLAETERIAAAKVIKRDSSALALGQLQNSCAYAGHAFFQM
jgi:hypothetical protein